MAVLFFLLWIIFNGRVTLEIVLFGIAISALLTLFICKVFGYSRQKDKWILTNLPICQTGAGRCGVSIRS